MKRNLILVWVTLALHSVSQVSCCIVVVVGSQLQIVPKKYNNRLPTINYRRQMFGQEGEFLITKSPAVFS